MVLKYLKSSYLDNILSVYLINPILPHRMKLYQLNIKINRKILIDPKIIPSKLSPHI